MFCKNEIWIDCCGIQFKIHTEWIHKIFQLLLLLLIIDVISTYINDTACVCVTAFESTMSIKLNILTLSFQMTTSTSLVRSLLCRHVIFD